MGKNKGKNKKANELKHGVLYMAQQLGSEKKLRKVFDIFEKSVSKPWSLPEKQIRTLLFKIAMSNSAVVELQEAFHYFDKLPKKRPNEDETRAGILASATRMGIPKQDVEAIFKRYDNLLKKATSEDERQQIAYMGAAELHRLMGVKGSLVMDGREIIPAEPGFDETGGSKFTKLD